MAEKTATSSSSSTAEKPDVQRTEELVTQGGPWDPDDYVPPEAKVSDEDDQWLITVVRTSDNAQQLFLDEKIDEGQLAKAVARFGKPANPSEVINRPDASYRRKLPRWVFSPPEGLGFPLEERLKIADEKNPHNPDAPLSHEQAVLLPPKEQMEEAKKREKEAEKREKANTPEKAVSSS